MKEETVAAISTPPGRSAIGIIRLTGPDAIKAAASVCPLHSGKADLNSVLDRTAHRCSIMHNGAKIDEALVTVYRAPRSYTGENMAEISCHGNPYILIKLMETLLEAGVKPAGPGEFTKRAFINGKLDLSEAEAVADIINAGNSASLSIALAQLNGREKKAVNTLRDSLLKLLSGLELAIDFSGEQHKVVTHAEAAKAAGEISVCIGDMIKNSEFGLMIKNGIRAVICGAPNAGKSSVLNALLKKERAIVNEIPGTTRDIIEDILEIQGLPFRLIDTAGIRKTSDPVEAEGVKRSYQEIKNADIVIFTVDASAPVIKGILPDNISNVIVAANKSDLHGSLDSSGICAALGIEPSFGVNVSALTGLGIDLLAQKAYSLVTGSKSVFDPAAVTVASLRHREALQSALVCVESALLALNSGMSPEFPASDIKRAAGFVSEITGDITGNDVLDSIFSKFCIGK